MNSGHDAVWNNDAAEHARHQQYEKQDRNTDSEHQRLHHARAAAAVAHQLDEGDAKTSDHRQQCGNDKDFDEPGSLHSGRLGRAWSFSIDRLLPSLIVIALMVLFIRLGFWQLQLADEARSLQAGVVAHAAAPPLTLTAAVIASTGADMLRWRRVEVQGRWDSGHQLLLDNQVVAGQVGYFVYTPLLIDDCSCAVLVNRGWVAMGRDRQSIPDVVLAPGTAIVSGMMTPPPPAGVGVGADLPEFLRPDLQRIQGLDPSVMSTGLGLRILPTTIRLDPAAADGYLRNWAPPPSRVERHMAYAAQWFLLALLAAVLLIGLNYRRHPGSNVDTRLSANGESIMNHVTNTPPDRLNERPVYFISNRPEAYELGGEVGHDAALEIARLIADHASRRFPGIDFRIDGDWHAHGNSMNEVVAYIEGHWQGWVTRGQKVAG